MVNKTKEILDPERLKKVQKINQYQDIEIRHHTTLQNNNQVIPNTSPFNIITVIPYILHFSAKVRYIGNKYKIREPLKTHNRKLTQNQRT